MKSAAEYGAEFAGFVESFYRGWATAEGSLNTTADMDAAMRLIILSAATDAWEDRLIRQRREENRAARAAEGRSD